MGHVRETKVLDRPYAILSKHRALRSLDGDRLKGSLHVPAAVFSQSAVRTQGRQLPGAVVRIDHQRANHEAVRALLEPKPLIAPYRRHFQRRETNMKIARTIFAGATLIFMTCSGAIAQQSLTGTISKVDEANGKIAIQQTQSGTVGANSGAAEELKVQDGLVFNAVQPGDKVVVTVTEAGGIKTITKLEKQ
jgi:Cu/Ag efflux protein CusF